MPTIFFTLETTITDMYFDDDRSNKEFEDWLNHMDDLFSVKVDLQPVSFENIMSIDLFINALEEDHSLSVGVSVNTGMSRTEILYNNDLISAIETELIPEFVRRFNANCDLAFPTSHGTFDDFLFMDTEFYLRVATRDYVKYESPRLSALEFQLTGKFREEF